MAALVRCVMVGAVVIGATLMTVEAGPSVAAPASENSAARFAPRSAPAPAYEAQLPRLKQKIAAAESALAASDGRVLDAAVRASLGAAVAVAEDHERLALVVDAMQGGLTGTADAGVPVVIDALDDAVTDVTAAVTAWETEQARLAAEKEAARIAAERAAWVAARTPHRGGSAPARASQGGASAPASGVAHTEHIRGSGGQAEIDRCNGSINVSPIANYLGGAFYAGEHWSCGGRSWGGIGVGSRVSFPGYGTYEVSQRVGGLAYGATAASLPRGFDGYYQTCINGSSTNMTVWALTRVG